MRSIWSSLRLHRCRWNAVYGRSLLRQQAQRDSRRLGAPAYPTIYYLREFAEAGGLASYGASIHDTYRQAGLYAGRVLNGAKPGDLPAPHPI